MLCFHACSGMHVCIITLYLWEVVNFLSMRGAIISVMIDVISAQETIEEVEILFDRVGIRLMSIVGISSATLGSARVSSSPSALVGVSASSLTSANVFGVFSFSCTLLRLVGLPIR